MKEYQKQIQIMGIKRVQNL